ncbi:ABATE domain-containing protein [Streptomyces sp. NPDC004783]|uniref:ABATE domain-containing protein n=1 Tax=Streptomyces sp. NPDC004783 TaxID=3154459 RepID=UPI0033A6B5A4
MSGPDDSAPRQRLADTARLKLWPGATGLDVPYVSPADLEGAVQLREVIYRAGSAIAAGGQSQSEDVHALNMIAVAGHTKAALGTRTRRMAPEGDGPCQ